MSAVPAGTPIEAGGEVIRTPVGGLGVAVRYTGILETLYCVGPRYRGSSATKCLSKTIQGIPFSTLLSSRQDLFLSRLAQ